MWTYRADVVLKKKTPKALTEWVSSIWSPVRWRISHAWCMGMSIYWIHHQSINNCTMHSKRLIPDMGWTPWLHNGCCPDGNRSKEGWRTDRWYSVLQLRTSKQNGVEELIFCHDSIGWVTVWIVTSVIYMSYHWFMNELVGQSTTHLSNQLEIVSSIPDSGMWVRLPIWEQ